MRYYCTVLLFSLLLSFSPAFARDYFVSSAGDDNRSGSEQEPWRTLSKINTTVFQPGDRILLKGGRHSRVRWNSGRTTKGLRREMW